MICKNNIFTGCQRPVLTDNELGLCKMCYSQRPLDEKEFNEELKAVIKENTELKDYKYSTMKSFLI